MADDAVNDELPELPAAAPIAIISAVHHSAFTAHHFRDVDDCVACG
jgi:hypothetical protein